MLLLTCPPCLFDKILQSRWILLSLKSLDSAGHVDRIRPDQANSFGDIFRRQPAREDDRRAEHLGGHRQFPVESRAGPAYKFGVVAIEQEGIHLIAAYLFNGILVLRLEAFYDPAPEEAAKIGRLGAVKLNAVEAAAVDHFLYLFRLLVDEDADPKDKRRQLSDYLLGFFRRNRPAARRVENKTQRVRPEIDRERRVFGIGYAANLDFNYLLSSTA